MHASAYLESQDRQSGMEEVKQHIAGQPLPRPFPDAEDKDLSGYDAEDKEPPDSIAARSEQRFNAALLRDARRAMASGPYLRASALGAGLRDIYEGGKRNLEGGIA